MKILTTRIPDNIYEDVKSVSRYDRISVSDFVRDAITEKLTNVNTLNTYSKENEESEKERTKEKVKEAKESRERDARVREVFDVPPFTEVQTYALQSPAIRKFVERDPMIIARFYDFYQAKGWVIGNQPMRSWQAALRNWLRRKGEFQPRQSVEDAKTAARDEKEKRERDRKQRERLEAARDPANWQLCAERCANFCDGRCTKGAKWPPQFNDRPIPPQECKHFSSVDKNK